MCRELAARGVTLLEADTDGVYFAVPDDVDRGATSAASSPRSAALLPPLVQLEFDGRYAAMLSHEPKNYALLALRRHARAARRRVPLEPRGAVRRGVPAPRDRAPARGDVAGVRDGLRRDGRRAAPARAARRARCRRACG